MLTSNSIALDATAVWRCAVVCGRVVYLRAGGAAHTPARPGPLPRHPVADVASLADAFSKSLSPAAEYFAAQGLPAPLIKYGHPGNM